MSLMSHRANAPAAVPLTTAAAAAATAADYLKCPHALAWTITNLAFSAMEFREGYTASGNW
jgi:hypothetical protein